MVRFPLPFIQSLYIVIVKRWLVTNVSQTHVQTAALLHFKVNMTLLQYQTKEVWTGSFFATDHCLFKLFAKPFVFQAEFWTVNGLYLFCFILA